HVVERTATLLRALGLPDPELGFDPGAIGELPTPESSSGGLHAPVLIQPGAGWGNKEYPPERWGRIAGTIGARSGRAVGVLAGPGEESLADRVVSASGGRARRVSPGGIDGLTRTLRDAGLVLGGDTGPVHLAHALGIPVLALHGPTSPDRHGPWRRRDRALWRTLPCSFCYRRFDAVKACLLEIPPERVAGRALEILEAARGPGPGPG
ncbi:MAG: glycosyltransferase family 9 protein, partial [Thermoanaerobaculia bacterium]|nr:glycosyltransferase family 9 protein [Thermoanaerobaculia bacterium]